MVVLQPIKPGPPRVSLSLKRGRARRALSLLGNNNTQHNLQLAESLLTISAEEFTNKWNFDPIQGVPVNPGRFQWSPLMTTSGVTSSDPNGASSVTPKPDATKPVVVVTPSEMASSSSSSSSEIPNPAQDNSHEQKTCVTLPPSVPCQVTAGQTTADLPKNPEPVNVKANSDSESHSCSPRTCACELSSSGCEKNVAVIVNVSEKGSLKMLSDSSVQTETDSTIDIDESISDEEGSNSDSSIDQSDRLTPTKLRQTCITEFVRPKKLSTFSVPEALSHTSSFSKKRPASSLQDPLNQPPHKKVLLHLRA